MVTGHAGEEGAAWGMDEDDKEESRTGVPD
jgi:hypothetical protein